MQCQMGLLVKAEGHTTQRLKGKPVTRDAMLKTMHSSTTNHTAAKGLAIRYTKYRENIRSEFWGTSEYLDRRDMQPPFQPQEQAQVLKLLAEFYQSQHLTHTPVKFSDKNIRTKEPSSIDRTKKTERKIGLQKKELIDIPAAGTI
jgi:hypothetical protein